MYVGRARVALFSLSPISTAGLTKSGDIDLWDVMVVKQDVNSTMIYPDSLTFMTLNYKCYTSLTNGLKSICGFSTSVAKRFTMCDVDVL